MSAGALDPTRYLLDKAMVREVVQDERAARDQAQWARMGAHWMSGSVAEVSWFKGTGPAFVEASRLMYERGVRSFHQMAPTIARVDGDRALAESGCTILLDGTAHGVQVFVTSHSRLFERLERSDGVWRIAGFRCVYEYDFMTPRDPSDRISLDRPRLAGYRGSYRYISYLLSESGQIPDPGLPGMDEPDAVADLLNADGAWLAGSR